MSKNTVKSKVNGKFEDVYIKNVPCFFASVHTPKKRHSQPSPSDKNQSKNEYSITVFVDDEARAMLENEVKVNKQIFEVGVDRNKKRAIKFKTSDQLEKDEKHHYDEVKGLHGVQFSLKEFSNSGNPSPLTVVGPDGKPFDELIGNMSEVSIKLWGYRNPDDLLTVALAIVKVEKHVPYEGGDPSKIVDDELGIDIDAPEQKEPQKAVEEEDDAPFDADVDEDDF